MTSPSLEHILTTSQTLYRNLEPVLPPQSFTFNDLLNSISVYAQTHTPEQTQSMLGELDNINQELQHPGTSDKHHEALELIQEFIKANPSLERSSHLSGTPKTQASFPPPPVMDETTLVNLAVASGEQNFKSLILAKKKGSPAIWSPGRLQSFS